MRYWILALMLGLVGSHVGRATEQAETPSAAAEGSAAHETLVRAIREKQVLRFVYNGHLRVVEPHAYGVSATGEVVLHAFQVDGESTSRPPPGWRTFSAGLIEQLVVTEGRFARPRSGYVPGEPLLATVWAALDAASE